MIARHQSFLFAAVLMAACNEPTGVLKEPPAELAFAKGGSVSAGVLLPTLGGAFGEARAVNDAGIVVGSSTDDTGALFAVRWTPMSGGSWSIAPIAGPGSRAVAINVNGTAVGLRAGRAKLWPATGGEIDLGPHLPGGINSAETVVGARIPNLGANPSQRAVVWRKPSTGWDLSSENAPQDLPPFPGGDGETVAKAINDAGVIAGWAGVSTATSIYYAVRWDPVGEQWAQPAALPGTESFSSTTGRAISDNSQPDFAGHVRECLQCSAVGIFWPNGTSPTTFFGHGSGWFEGINNTQRAVGVLFDPRHGDRAFVWWPGQASFQDLRGSGGYSTTHAYDINNLSPAQAVGSAQGPNPSRSRAIVWTIP